MEAKVQSELPRGDAWQYEPKWDGFRAVAFKDGDEVIIHSRNAKNLTRYFPELVPALQGIKPKRVVLDGEIVIFAGYGTDFDAMQLRIHPAASRVNMLANEMPSTYIAFDLLAEGDESLLNKPLKERRQRLEKLLGPKPETIRLSPVTKDREVALDWLKEYRGTGLDGIVAKRVDSIYHPGERAMVKVKEQRTADVVVGGFRWGNDGKRVGSLLLGVYRGKTFEFVGHTSGFDDTERRELVKVLEPLRSGTSFGDGRAREALRLGLVRLGRLGLDRLGMAAPGLAFLFRLVNAGDLAVEFFGGLLRLIRQGLVLRRFLDLPRDLSGVLRRHGGRPAGDRLRLWLSHYNPDLRQYVIIAISLRDTPQLTCIRSGKKQGLGRCLHEGS